MSFSFSFKLKELPENQLDFVIVNQINDLLDLRDRENNPLAPYISLQKDSSIHIDSIKKITRGRKGEDQALVLQEFLADGFKKFRVDLGRLVRLDHKKYPSTSLQDDHYNIFKMLEKDLEHKLTPRMLQFLTSFDIQRFGLAFEQFVSLDKFNEERCSYQFMEPVYHADITVDNGVLEVVSHLDYIRASKWDSIDQPYQDRGLHEELKKPLLSSNIKFKFEDLDPKNEKANKTGNPFEFIKGEFNGLTIDIFEEKLAQEVFQGSIKIVADKIRNDQPLLPMDYYVLDELKHKYQDQNLTELKISRDELFLIALINASKAKEIIEDITNLEKLLIHPQGLADLEMIHACHQEAGNYASVKDSVSTVITTKRAIDQFIKEPNKNKANQLLALLQNQEKRANVIYSINALDVDKIKVLLTYEQDNGLFSYKKNIFRNELTADEALRLALKDVDIAKELLRKHWAPNQDQPSERFTEVHLSKMLIKHPQLWNWMLSHRGAFHRNKNYIDALTGEVLCAIFQKGDEAAIATAAAIIATHKNLQGRLAFVKNRDLLFKAIPNIPNFLWPSIDGWIYDRLTKKFQPTPEELKTFYQKRIQKPDDIKKALRQVLASDGIEDNQIRIRHFQAIIANITGFLNTVTNANEPSIIELLISNSVLEGSTHEIYSQFLNTLFGDEECLNAILDDPSMAEKLKVYEVWNRFINNCSDANLVKAYHKGFRKTSIEEMEAQRNRLLQHADGKQLADIYLSNENRRQHIETSVLDPNPKAKILREATLPQLAEIALIPENEIARSINENQEILAKFIKAISITQDQPFIDKFAKLYCQSPLLQKLVGSDTLVINKLLEVVDVAVIDKLIKTNKIIGKIAIDVCLANPDFRKKVFAKEDLLEKILFQVDEIDPAWLYINDKDFRERLQTSQNGVQQHLHEILHDKKQFNKFPFLGSLINGIDKQEAPAEKNDASQQILEDSATDDEPSENQPMVDNSASDVDEDRSALNKFIAAPNRANADALLVILQNPQERPDVIDSITKLNLESVNALLAYEQANGLFSTKKAIFRNELKADEALCLALKDVDIAKELLRKHWAPNQEQPSERFTATDLSKMLIKHPQLWDWMLNNHGALHRNKNYIDALTGDALCLIFQEGDHESIATAAKVIATNNTLKRHLVSVEKNVLFKAIPNIPNFLWPSIDTWIYDQLTQEFNPSKKELKIFYQRRIQNPGDIKKVLEQTLASNNIQHNRIRSRHFKAIIELIPDFLNNPDHKLSIVKDLISLMPSDEPQESTRAIYSGFLEALFKNEACLNALLDDPSMEAKLGIPQVKDQFIDNCSHANFIKAYLTFQDNFGKRFIAIVDELRIRLLQHIDDGKQLADIYLNSENMREYIVTPGENPTEIPKIKEEATLAQLAEIALIFKEKNGSVIVELSQHLASSPQEFVQAFIADENFRNRFINNDFIVNKLLDTLAVNEDRVSLNSLIVLLTKDFGAKIFQHEACRELLLTADKTRYFNLYMQLVPESLEYLDQAIVETKRQDLWLAYLYKLDPDTLLKICIKNEALREAIINDLTLKNKLLAIPNKTTKSRDDYVIAPLELFKIKPEEFKKDIQGNPVWLLQAWLHLEPEHIALLIDNEETANHLLDCSIQYHRIGDKIIADEVIRDALQAHGDGELFQRFYGKVQKHIATEENLLFRDLDKMALALGQENDESIEIITNIKEDRKFAKRVFNHKEILLAFIGKVNWGEKIEVEECLKLPNFAEGLAKLYISGNKEAKQKITELSKDLLPLFLEKLRPITLADIYIKSLASDKAPKKSIRDGISTENDFVRAIALNATSEQLKELAKDEVLLEKLVGRCFTDVKVRERFKPKDGGSAKLFAEMLRATTYAKSDTDDASSLEFSNALANHLNTDFFKDNHKDNTHLLEFICQSSKLDKIAHLLKEKETQNLVSKILANGDWENFDKQLYATIIKGVAVVDIARLMVKNKEFRDYLITDLTQDALLLQQIHPQRATQILIELATQKDNFICDEGEIKETKFNEFLDSTFGNWPIATMLEKATTTQQRQLLNCYSGRDEVINHLPKRKFLWIDLAPKVLADATPDQLAELFAKDPKFMKTQLRKFSSLRRSIKKVSLTKLAEMFVADKKNYVNNLILENPRQIQKRFLVQANAGDEDALAALKLMLKKKPQDTLALLADGANRYNAHADDIFQKVLEKFNAKELLESIQDTENALNNKLNVLSARVESCNPSPSEKADLQIQLLITYKHQKQEVLANNVAGKQLREKLYEVASPDQLVKFNGDHDINKLAELFDFYLSTTPSKRSEWLQKPSLMLFIYAYACKDPEAFEALKYLEPNWADNFAKVFTNVTAENKYEFRALGNIYEEMLKQVNAKELRNLFLSDEDTAEKILTTEGLNSKLFLGVTNTELMRIYKKYSDLQETLLTNVDFCDAFLDSLYGINETNGELNEEILVKPKFRETVNADEKLKDKVLALKFMALTKTKFCLPLTSYVLSKKACKALAKALKPLITERKYEADYKKLNPEFYELVDSDFLDDSDVSADSDTEKSLSDDSPSVSLKMLRGSFTTSDLPDETPGLTKDDGRPGSLNMFIPSVLTSDLSGKTTDSIKPGSEDLGDGIYNSFVKTNS